MNFDYREQERLPLQSRFVPDVVGKLAWSTLVSEVVGSRSPSPEASELDPVLESFNKFLGAVAGEARPTSCRLFVSHQRQDVLLAERIAYLATRAGFEYWLDVHDPFLQWANQAPIPPVVQSVLIAAIIEMALLNCTHGVTVQTARAQQSRWAPYEFGRVKQRQLTSTKVASWFEKGQYSATTADYLKLGICVLSENALVRWLQAEQRRVPCSATVPWIRTEPAPLPP